MTRRKPAHDLDAFHAHLDALKLSFVREHYADGVFTGHVGAQQVGKHQNPWGQAA